MMVGAPVALALVIVAWFVLLRLYPCSVDEIRLLDDDSVEPDLPGRRERLIVGGIVLVTAALWVTTPLHLEFFTQFDSDLLVLAVLALVTVALSNFMSNTAAVSLIVPIAVALLPGRELAVCMVLGLSASCALLLPVSTPPNAVALATGEIQIRDLRPGGLLIGLPGPAVIIAWALLVAPLIR